MTKRPKLVKKKRTCVVCGRVMTVRADGQPWHPKCGREGGMSW